MVNRNNSSNNNHNKKQLATQLKWQQVAGHWTLNAKRQTLNGNCQLPFEIRQFQNAKNEPSNCSSQ